MMMIVVGFRDGSDEGMTGCFRLFTRATCGSFLAFVYSVHYYLTARARSVRQNYVSAKRLFVCFPYFSSDFVVVSPCCAV